MSTATNLTTHVVQLNLTLMEAVALNEILVGNQYFFDAERSFPEEKNKSMQELQRKISSAIYETIV